MPSKINKERVLFLWLNKNEFHAVNASRRGVKVASVYKKVSFLFRVLRRVQIKLNLFSIRPWLESWLSEIDDFETVIIHASKITPPVVKYLKKIKPDLRIIVWYWNPVIKSEKVKSFSLKDCEIWSFDESDVAKYNLKYNTQYYFKDFVLSENEKDKDVFFVGGDKGRLSLLLEIRKLLEEAGLSTNFHIVKTSRKLKNNYTFREKISYECVLDKLSRSNVVLDVVSENQTGLTIRPLESIYFSKKLITNDISIMNRDFYNSKNIFIYGYDSNERLLDFIENPFDEIPEDILDKYDFEQWLSRFYSEKSKTN